MDLLDLMREPAIIRPCDPDGAVVQGEPDEVLTLARPASAMARIELHHHIDGMWMWSTSANLQWTGWAYRVGPKWGKFAHCRDDALHWAINEMRDMLTRSSDDPTKKRILEWLEKLS